LIDDILLYSSKYYCLGVYYYYKSYDVFILVDIYSLLNGLKLEESESLFTDIT